MDAAFLPIYQELTLEFDPGFQLRGRRGRAVYARADRLAFEAVHEAIQTFQGKLRVRPDARLFMVSNLALMVARPLMHPAVAAGDPERIETLRALLMSDARRVLQDARLDKMGEVSAAAVVRSLAQNLERLQLKEWRLWDRVE